MNPQPRRDDKNVPWCWSQCPELPLGLAECLVQSAGGLCLPAVQQDQERVKELEVCESELDRLDTYLHDPGDDDGTVTATIKVMEQWCADLRKALDRIKELEAVVEQTEPLIRFLSEQTFGDPQTAYARLEMADKMRDLTTPEKTQAKENEQ